MSRRQVTPTPHNKPPTPRKKRVTKPAERKSGNCFSTLKRLFENLWKAITHITKKVFYFLYTLVRGLLTITLFPIVVLIIIATISITYTLLTSAIQWLANYIPLISNSIPQYVDKNFGFFSDVTSSTLSALIVHFIIKWLETLHK